MAEEVWGSSSGGSGRKGDGEAAAVLLEHAKAKARSAGEAAGAAQAASEKAAGAVEEAEAALVIERAELLTELESHLESTEGDAAATDVY